MSQGEALQSVRELRKLDIASVATAALIAEDSLVMIEANEKRASFRQLQRLAEIYGVPIYSLGSGRLPKLRPLPEDYRRRDPSPASLSPKGLKVLWASERISVFTKQLAVELNFIPRDYSAVGRQENSPEKKGEAVRGFFDSWLSKRGKNLPLYGDEEQKFATAFRIFIESQGIVVNVNKAPHEDYLGFFIKPADGCRTLFVNRSIQSKKGQLFTLAHEYAHFIFNASGISDPFKIKNNIERACNQFAAGFIAPEESFIQITESASLSVRNDVFRFINFISNKTFLSRHATAIRLIETSYLTRKDYRDWLGFWRRRPAWEKEVDREEAIESGESAVAFGQPHAKRTNEIGTLPIYLAEKAISNKLIDRYDVVSGLNLSISLQDKAYDLARRRLGGVLER